MEQRQGKSRYGAIRTALISPIETRGDLSKAYTPGVADLCRKISADPSRAYDLTIKKNSVAVLSDCTRVLGLGDIGALAGLPVMEGKAALFRRFGGVDAFPICTSTKTADELIAVARAIAPSFGAINLEDISAPKCFEVEQRLIAELDIPVMHDDQHGTAVVALAGALSSLRVAGKKFESARVLVNGAGAAGSAIAKLLAKAGAGEVISFDRAGALFSGRADLGGHKLQLASSTNPKKFGGSLLEACEGADMLIGVSSPGAFTPEMIRKMAEKPAIFALSNPVPEIALDEAKKAGAFIYASARSDLPNQINNALAFPGIFRGALDVRASRITEGMKMAAAHALFGRVRETGESADSVISDPFDQGAHFAVAYAVASQSVCEGIAKDPLKDNELREKILANISAGKK